MRKRQSMEALVDPDTSSTPRVTAMFGRVTMNTSPLVAMDTDSGITVKDTNDYNVATTPSAKGGLVFTCMSLHY